MDLNDALAKTTVLQSKLYQAAVKDPKRRFYRLYDRIFREDVLWSAWKQVRENGGAPGIDGVTIKSIEDQGVAAYLEELGQELRKQTYKPQPLRRVEIPKGNGKTRPLGIPTVKDRIVQSAAKLILEPIFEADFADTSYGFRPGIGQREALAAVATNASNGLRFVVDADIEGFFDHLDHDLLMEALRRRISDGAVLRLIYRWLKAGVLVGLSLEKTDQGTPQGGVISPLLANVYLHGLDAAMRDDRTIGFVGRLARYADDLVIQCRTCQQAERALGWLSSILGRLGLHLNATKTRIVNDAVEGFDFLGFHHHRVTHKGGKGLPQRWPSKKACQKFRDTIAETLRRYGRIRSAGDWHGLARILNAYIRGWGSYFRHGHGRKVLAKLDWHVTERVGRYLARCQPTGKHRKRRHWQHYAAWVRTGQRLLALASPTSYSNPYRGRANVRWKAV